MIYPAFIMLLVLARLLGSTHISARAAVLLFTAFCAAPPPQGMARRAWDVTLLLQHHHQECLRSQVGDTRSTAKQLETHYQ